MNKAKNDNKINIKKKKQKEDKDELKKSKHKSKEKAKRKKENKKGNNNKNFPPKKTKSKMGLQSSLLSTNKSLKQGSKMEQINIILNDESKKFNKNGINNNQKKQLYKLKDSNTNLRSETVKNVGNDNKYKLNDEELNELEYEVAIELDKRTYFQYYISLIKKKHLILFAFWPNDDYNLTAIKISLLILAFSLYFTINGFFFSDETMNKINEDKGAFNLLFQIPQILYSTLISAIINLILKRLSLTEKQILIIKQEHNYKEAENKSKKVKLCLKTKLLLFYIISFLLFFWYFISCFCAVYKNTQIILIKDTLISFGLSMLYPFGLNLFPGMFRIPALRALNKNMKYLYQLSGFIALI